jgi:hypothetical protein
MRFLQLIYWLLMAGALIFGTCFWDDALDGIFSPGFGCLWLGFGGLALSMLFIRDFDPI